jgi:hypothetical protein
MVERNAKTRLVLGAVWTDIGIKNAMGADVYAFLTIV